MMRVLVAEPHHLSAVLLRRLLELRGHQVDVAESPDAARAAIAHNGAYDRVIADAAIALALPPPVERGAIIATTARLRSAVEPALRERGVTRLLTKPIRVADLDGALGDQRCA